jgi:hypothetical protein
MDTKIKEKQKTKEEVEEHPKKTQKTEETPNPTTKAQSLQRTWATLNPQPLASNPTRSNTHFLIGKSRAGSIHFGALGEKFK